jgi:hypothetical protein
MSHSDLFSVTIENTVTGDKKDTLQQKQKIFDLGCQ